MYIKHSIFILLLLFHATVGFDLRNPFAKKAASPTVYSWDGGPFSMQWSIQNDVMNLTMTGNTNGWISVGICKTTSMRYCDFWTGWVVDSSQAVVLLDTWSTGDSTPHVDKQSDLTLISGTQSGGSTSITFSRPLRTGDTSQDFDIENKDVVVGWATYGKDGSSPSKYGKHNKAGWVTINFVTGNSSGISKFDAGKLLAAIVLALLALWAFIHIVRKLWKMIQKHLAKRELENHPRTAVTSIQVDAAPSNDIPLEEISVQKGQYMKNESSMDHASPKEDCPSCFNCVEGCLSHRLPCSEISFGFIVLFLGYCALNVGCLYYSSGKWSYKVGDILAANIFFLTVPATRNSALVYLLGVPFDKTIRFHRWLGRLAVALTCTHFALFLVEWEQPEQMWEQIKIRTNVWGLAALGCGLVIFFTSFNFIRRKGFGFFYWVHFIFIAFWVFSFLHNEKMKAWVIATVVVYLFDKLMRFIWGTLPQKTTDFKLKGFGQDQILQVKLKKSKLAGLLNLYDVGQYVFVNFPQVSLLEWHPYSVSSGPGETTLEIHIKGIGDHTRHILKKASKEKSLIVRVEGPYGDLNVNYRRFPVVVLVGGGIGLTPLLGMLRDLAGTGTINPHYFGGKSFVKKLHLVWVVPNMSVYEWFGAEIQECLKALSNTGTEATISIYLTRERSVDNNNAMFHAGRPDMKEVFNNIVKDADGLATGVFVCGPQTMIEDVWDRVNGHRMKGETMHFHKETFEL